MVCVHAEAGPCTSTYRAANAHMTCAKEEDRRSGASLRPGAGLSGLHGKGQGTSISAAELARQDNIHLGDVPDTDCYISSSREAAPLHPPRAYIDRVQPIDPSSWAGMESDQDSTSAEPGSISTDREGAGPHGKEKKAVGVKSAVYFGFDHTEYVTETMNLLGQKAEELKLRQPFIPVVSRRFTLDDPPQS